MKKSIIFLVLIFTFQLAQSQVTDSLTVKSNQEMYDFYISKHKKLKKTGWILLGAGFTGIVVGGVIAATSDIFDDDNQFETGSILFAAGSLTALASIPVFISARKNKSKANTILGSGEIGIGAIPFNDNRYASVGIKINF